MKNKTKTIRDLKRFISDYYIDHKIIPDLKTIKTFLGNVDESVLQKNYDFLLKHNFILQGNKGLYIAPETLKMYRTPPEEQAQHRIDKPIKIKKPLPKIKLPVLTFLKKSDTKTDIHLTGFFFLKIFLFFIGTGATYMSILYSYTWFLSFLSYYNALILAVIMVLYAVGSFELIVLFYLKGRKFIAFIFSFLWVIVTLFSMTSTVAGQYNSRMQEIKAVYERENKQFQNNSEVDTYNTQMELYKHELELTNSELERIQKALLQFESLDMINENRRLYNSLYYQRRLASNNKIKLNEKIENLIKEKPVQILEKKELNFYQWVSMIFKFTPDNIQFWLSVFPALFIDLIAPLSFAVILFLQGNKNVA